jgi:hypothetical protein
MLVQVKSKRKRSLPVRPPGVEKTSSLDSRDLVASGVKCGPHRGKNNKMKSWPSHDAWRRLHRVRGVFGGSQENHWVHWLIHKDNTEEPKMEVQQH